MTLQVSTMSKSVSALLRGILRSVPALCLLGCMPAWGQDYSRVYNDGRIYMSMSKDGERLTVRAKDVPRREVFRVLEAVYGIEVRPVEAAYQAISAEFTDQPLDRGLARLLPAGSRYVVRTERERSVGLEAGVKEGPRVAVVAGRPEKPREGAVGPAPKAAARGVLKPDPRLARQITDLRVSGGKPPARASLIVPEGRGAKVAKVAVVAPPAQTEQKGAVRLSFIMRSTGEVTLTHAVAVEGNVPVSRQVRGPFVFMIRDAAGGVRYFETQKHPLVKHSYRPSGIHDEKRVREGIFGVWVPKELIDREGPNLRLLFYDAQDVRLPAELDERALNRALEQVKPIAEVKGEEVVRVLRGGNR